MHVWNASLDLVSPSLLEAVEDWAAVLISTFELICCPGAVNGKAAALPCQSSDFPCHLLAVT